jgi:hypothetical protein
LHEEYQILWHDSLVTNELEFGEWHECFFTVLLMEKTFKHRHIYVTASADALRRVAVSRTTVEITSAIKPPRNDVIDLLTSK